jgi:hypothetical protein
VRRSRLFKHALTDSQHPYLVDAAAQRRRYGSIGGALGCVAVVGHPVSATVDAGEAVSLNSSPSDRRHNCLVGCRGAATDELGASAE